MPPVIMLHLIQQVADIFLKIKTANLITFSFLFHIHYSFLGYSIPQCALL